MLPSVLLPSILAANPLAPARGDALSGLWPQPASASASGDRAVCLGNLTFDVRTKLGSASKARLERAFGRTADKIYGPGLWTPAADEPVSVATGSLQTLAIYIASQDETLSVTTNESYSIQILGPAATLRAQTVHALRDIQVRLQLSLASHPRPASLAHGVATYRSASSSPLGGRGAHRRLLWR